MFWGVCQEMTQSQITDKPAAPREKNSKHTHPPTHPLDKKHGRIQKFRQGAGWGSCQRFWYGIKSISRSAVGTSREANGPKGSRRPYQYFKVTYRHLWFSRRRWGVWTPCPPPPLDPLMSLIPRNDHLNKLTTNQSRRTLTAELSKDTIIFEPWHVISNNVAFWQV